MRPVKLQPKSMFLLLGALAVPACATAHRTTQAQALLAAIDAHGAQAVLDSVWRDRRASQAVFNSIKSGDTLWLEVARRLRPVSDAGATDDLTVPLSFALQHAPERVLRLLGDPFPLEEVCTGPFYETTRKFERQYLTAVIDALQRVREPALIPARDRCLTEFRREAASLKADSASLSPAR